MESLLPSEIARLVYGYLKDEGCSEAAEMFLETSVHLNECQKTAKQGRRFHTRVMGRSLVDMLDVFSTVHSLVQDRLNSSQDVITNSTLLSNLENFLSANDTTKKASTVELAVCTPIATKADEASSRSVIDSGLKPYATSTPYSTCVSPNRKDDTADDALSVSGTCARKQLLTKDVCDKEKSSVDPEELQKYMKSVNRALLDNTQIHEKLAEKINEKRTATENQSLDTLGRNIVMDIDIENIIDEIIDSAKVYEAKSIDQSLCKQNNCNQLDTLEIGTLEPTEDSENTNRIQESAKSTKIASEENSAVISSPLKAGNKIITSQNDSSEASISVDDTVIEQQINNSNTTKNIIEKAMRSSFISPIKCCNQVKNKCGDVNKYSGELFDVSEKAKQNTIIPYDSNINFTSGVNVLTQSKQSNEQFQSNTAVVFNSLPNIVPANFVVASPMLASPMLASPMLAFNITGHPVVNPPIVCSAPPKLKQILPATVSSSIPSSPVVSHSPVVANNSVVLVSSQNSNSSSNIFTSDSVPVPLLSVSEHATNQLHVDTDGTDKPSKVLIENVPWRKKKSVHVRACDKVVKGRLTKITPKPSSVIHQEATFRAGATTILSNGVAVEVLNENNITQSNGPLENSSITNTTNVCIENMDTCVVNTTLPSMNDSSMLVIDTSQYDTTCVSGQNDVNKEKSVECVLSESQTSVATDIVKEDGKLNDNNSGEQVENVKENLSEISAPKDNHSDDKKNTCTESHSKKNKTPGQNQPVNKRRSMSTPRRNNHIRALDFSTPDRHIRLHKTNTSPKSASRLKPNLKMNNIVRSGLFKSPENKVDVVNTDKEGVSKKDDFGLDTLLSSEVIPMIEADVSETPVKSQVEKDSSLNTPKITLTAPIDHVDSPVPKLAADWDAVSGLGMIVGDGKCNKKLSQTPDVPLSWDAKLRSFVDTNQEVVSIRPKRHSRRKIGSNVQSVKETENEVDEETSKTKGSKKTTVNRKSKTKKVNVANKRRSPKTKLTKRSTHVNTRSRTLAKKRATSEENLNNSKDTENSSNSAINSPSCNTSNETLALENDELSSDLAMKIEKNILNHNSDFTNLETNFSDANSNCAIISCLSKQDNNQKESETLLKTSKTSATFLIPEESVSKVKKSPENHTCLQLPLLKTPVKSNIDSVTPQTPIVTPFLKSIEQNTRVLLLTPGFPPTPAALREKEISFQTPVNEASTESMMTPLKDAKNTPIKNNALEQELIAECRRIENISKTKKQDESIIERSLVLLQETIAEDRSESNKTQAEKDKINDESSSLITAVSPPNKDPVTLANNDNSVDKNTLVPNNKEKNNELKTNNEDKLHKSKSGKDSAKKKKVKSSKVKKNSKDKLISGFLRQAVHSVFGSSCSSSESDTELDTQPTVLKKQPVINTMTAADDKPAVSEQILESCESNSKKSIASVPKTVNKVSPKPKKYVKTILLSPNVKGKVRLEKEIVSPNKIESNLRSCKGEGRTPNKNKVEPNLEDLELQRAILNKKLQRTIDVLNGPTRRLTRSAPKPDDSKTSKSAAFNKRNRRVTSKALIDTSSDDSSNGEMKDKSEIVVPVLKQHTAEQMKKGHGSGSVAASNGNKTNLNTLQAQEDNAVSSPLKQHFSGLIAHSVNTSNTLMPANVRKGSETETKLNNLGKDLLLSKEIKKTVVLPSNEGYWHVVYDEKKAKPLVKKSYNSINDFEMTICAEDDSQDITCRLRVHPLQTLLEILPSNCNETVTTREMENVRHSKSHHNVFDEFCDKDIVQDLNRSKTRSSSSKHHSPRQPKEHSSRKRSDTFKGREISKWPNGRFNNRYEREYYSSVIAKQRMYKRHMLEGNHYIIDRRNKYYDTRKRPPHSSMSPVDVVFNRRARPHNYSMDHCLPNSISPTNRRHISKYMVGKSSSPSMVQTSNRPNSKCKPEMKNESNNYEQKSTNLEIHSRNSKNQVFYSSEAKSVSDFDKRNQSILNDSSPASKVNLLSSKIKKSPIKMDASHKNNSQASTQPAPDTDVEEGEIISVCGDDNIESEICGDDLMDLAIMTTKEHSTTRISTKNSTSSKLAATLRKRKASSDNQAHILEKKQKPDDAQRLLKNLDSEDLEQFLSAVHSETENI